MTASPADGRAASEPFGLASPGTEEAVQAVRATANIAPRGCQRALLIMHRYYVRPGADGKNAAAATAACSGADRLCPTP